MNESTHSSSAPADRRAGDHVPCETDAPLSVAAITFAAGDAHQAALIAKLTLSIADGGIATIVATPRALGGDVYQSEPLASPLRSASDFAPVKPRVDVTLVGVVAEDVDARRDVIFAFGGARGFVREVPAAKAASLGPIAPTHPSRWSRLGTFDASWAAQGWPSDPRDHDPRFHQSAPLEQQLDRLRGDEPFEIIGWRGASTLRGTLPGVRVSAGVARTDGRVEDVALKLDTVAFDLVRLEVDLVFRGHAACADRRGRDLERVVFRTTGAASGAARGEDASTATRRTRSAPLQGPSRAEVEALVAAGATLAGAILAGAALAGIDLSGLDLTGADLTGAVLDGANLSGAILDRADLSGVRAVGVDLSGARAARARFCEADLTHARLDGCALPAADLTRARLDHASLRRAELIDAKLYAATARGADLGEVRAANARAEGAILDGANLERASFAGADLERASVLKARLRGAVLDDAGARGAAFDGADLSRASARQARLSEASFDGARLVSANLMQAELDGARLTGADLRSANLYRADLNGADIRGARLEKAAIVGTVLARTA